MTQEYKYASKYRIVRLRNGKFQVQRSYMKYENWVDTMDVYGLSSQEAYENQEGFLQESDAIEFRDKVFKLEIDRTVAEVTWGPGSWSLSTCTETDPNGEVGGHKEVPQPNPWENFWNLGRPK